MPSLGKSLNTKGSRSAKTMSIFDLKVVGHGLLRFFGVNVRPHRPHEINALSESALAGAAVISPGAGVSRALIAHKPIGVNG